MLFIGMYSIKLLYLCYYILKKKKKGNRPKTSRFFVWLSPTFTITHTYTPQTNYARFSILIRLVIWFIYSYIKANKAFVGILFWMNLKNVFVRKSHAISQYEIKFCVQETKDKKNGYTCQTKTNL